MPNEIPNSRHFSDSSAQRIQSGWGFLLWWYPNTNTATEITYKHINRLGTKVALSTLIQNILIFIQVLASIISCYRINHSLTRLFFGWVQKGPPGLCYLLHGIWSKNAWHSKREKICGTWELTENWICASWLMEISNDSNWGSRLVNWIMPDKYYTHTSNLGSSQEKNPNSCLWWSSVWEITENTTEQHGAESLYQISTEKLF